MNKRKTQNKNKKITFKTTCPICGEKLSLASFDQHRKQNHKHLSHKEFETIVIDAIKLGKIQAKYFEASNYRLVSGTQRMRKAFLKDKGGLFHISQGGKVSPK